jgi:hypothetical protein
MQTSLLNHWKKNEEKEGWKNEKRKMKPVPLSNSAET